jgi:hypothetical protein
MSLKKHGKNACTLLFLEHEGKRLFAGPKMEGWTLLKLCGRVL